MTGRQQSSLNNLQMADSNRHYPGWLSRCRRLQQ